MWLERENTLSAWPSLLKDDVDDVHNTIEQLPFCFNYTWRLDSPYKVREAHHRQRTKGKSQRDSLEFAKTFLSIAITLSVYMCTPFAEKEDNSHSYSLDLNGAKSFFLQYRLTDTKTQPHHRAHTSWTNHQMDKSETAGSVLSMVPTTHRLTDWISSWLVKTNNARLYLFISHTSRLHSFPSGGLRSLSLNCRFNFRHYLLFLCLFLSLVPSLPSYLKFICNFLD